MQTKTYHSAQADQVKPSQAQSRDDGPTLTLLNENQEGSTPESNYWLDKQFGRLPYKLCQFWLGITLIIVPIAEFFVIDSFLESFENYIIDISEIFALGCLAMSMSFVLLMFGSAGMLFAMWKKKSLTAQESFLKFQYSMISSLLGLLFLLNGNFMIFSHYPGADVFVCMALIITPISHLLGGFYVLKMFKKNHPLLRQEASEETDQLSKEFLEQNEAIRSEILRFDEQLDTWSYFLYKIWLKFFVIIEIMRMGICIIYESAFIIQNKEVKWLIELIGIVLFSLSLFLSVWSSFKVELVLRTKKLAESKRAIFLLTVSIGVSTMIFVLALFESILGILNLLTVVPLLYLLWFSYGIFANIITLIGAIKIKRIVEQRENLIGYSNYIHDSYL